VADSLGVVISEKCCWLFQYQREFLRCDRESRASETVSLRWRSTVGDSSPVPSAIYQVSATLPDIRRQTQRGDMTGATERMRSLWIAAGLQRLYIKTTLDPATRHQ
jgi:hypothetical protein